MRLKRQAGARTQNRILVSKLKFGSYTTCNGKLLRRSSAMCHVTVICF